MFRVHPMRDAGPTPVLSRLPDLFAASFFLSVAVVLFTGVISMVGEFGSAYAIAAPASQSLAKVPSAAPGSVALGSTDCRATAAGTARRT